MTSIDKNKNLYDIFFVDFGDEENVGLEDLLPLPTKFMELPFQAVRCRLAHIQPYGMYPRNVCLFCDLRFEI